jgi:hypothetical protein
MTMGKISASTAAHVVAGWLFGLVWVFGWLEWAKRGTAGAVAPLSGTKEEAMTAQPRDTDNALIDEAAEFKTPSQGGSSGGNLAREVGERDEQASATGKDPSVTRVHKGDKPKGGDEPTLPNRGPAS